MTVDTAALLGQRLTPHEVEILTAISLGYADKQISTRLIVTESTVKTHVRRISAKLGTRSRAHMVRIGFIQGYLRIPAQAPKSPGDGRSR